MATVHILIADYCDGYNHNATYEAYNDLSDARAKLATLAAQERELSDEQGWILDSDTPDCFCTYIEGYAAEECVAIKIESLEIK